MDTESGHGYDARTVQRLRLSCLDVALLRQPKRASLPADVGRLIVAMNNHE